MNNSTAPCGAPKARGLRERCGCCCCLSFLLRCPKVSTSRLAERRGLCDCAACCVAPMQLCLHRVCRCICYPCSASCFHQRVMIAGPTSPTRVPPTFVESGLVSVYLMCRTLNPLPKMKHAMPPRNITLSTCRSAPTHMQTCVQVGTSAVDVETVACT